MSVEITEQERDKYAYTAVCDIDNTFLSNYGSKKISLNELFLVLRHTRLTVDDLPSDVRAKYEEALPYLKKRFHRE